MVTDTYGGYSKNKALAERGSPSYTLGKLKLRGTVAKLVAEHCNRVFLGFQAVAYHIHCRLVRQTGYQWRFPGVALRTINPTLEIFLSGPITPLSCLDHWIRDITPDLGSYIWAHCIIISFYKSPKNSYGAFSPSRAASPLPVSLTLFCLISYFSKL